MRELTYEQQLKELQEKCKELVDIIRPFATYYHHSMERLEGRIIISRAMMPDEYNYKPGNDVWLDNNDFRKAHDTYDRFQVDINKNLLRKNMLYDYALSVARMVLSEVVPRKHIDHCKGDKQQCDLCNVEYAIKEIDKVRADEVQP